MNRTNLLVAIFLAVSVLSIGVPAQKQTKEEKQKAKMEEEKERATPRSITVRAPLQAIKDELLRHYLTAPPEKGRTEYSPCVEQPSRLVFCRGLDDKLQQASISVWGQKMHFEHIFTFVPADENSFTVIAVSDGVEVNRLGVENRLRYMTKEVRTELQNTLDNLKMKLEAKK